MKTASREVLMSKEHFLCVRVDMHSKFDGHVCWTGNRRWQAEAKAKAEAAARKAAADKAKDARDRGCQALVF